MGWLVPMREYPSLRFETEEKMIDAARALLADWAAEKERKEMEEYRALLLNYLGKGDPANG